LVPVALVGLAVVLTVPWTFLVFRAIYQRDVLDNAQALARRVETHLTMAPPTARSQSEIERAVRTELISDPAVQTLAFYEVSEVPDVEYLAFVRKRTSPIPKLSVTQIQDLSAGVPMETEDGDMS